MSELHGDQREVLGRQAHINPWLVPYVLDVDELEPLPVSRTTTAGCNLMASSYWSGFISTDLVTITWDPVCACERQGKYLDPEIQRVPAT